MILPFTKMQGIGNDFVLLDARSAPLPNYGRLAEQLCHRRTGIGADGLMIVEAEDGFDARKRFFNPDGTEDFCGNGLRCFARYVGDVLEKSQVRLSTIAGERTAQTNLGEHRNMVRVPMGQAKFDPSELPAETGHPILGMPLEIGGERVEINSVSTGSLHTVLFVSALPDDELFLRISRALEHHPLFPQRTSVMWAVEEASARFRIRIWERGVGETLGCGTGACAVAAVAHRLGMCSGEVLIESRGGILTIDVTDDGELTKTGPAEYVFTGQMEIDPDSLPA